MRASPTRVSTPLYLLTTHADPDSAAPILSNLAALVLTHYSDTARAEQLLLRALATSPTDAHSLNSYGLYLHSSGGDKNIDDAEHLFRIAIAIDDTHLDAMNNLAVLLETMRADPPAIHTNLLTCLLTYLLTNIHTYIHHTYYIHT